MSVKIITVDLHPLEKCPDCGVPGAHYCTGTPTTGATGWAGRRVHGVILPPAPDPPGLEPEKDTAEVSS